MFETSSGNADTLQSIYVDGRQRGAIQFKRYRLLLSRLFADAEVEAAFLVCTMIEWSWYATLFAFLLPDRVEASCIIELAVICCATFWLTFVVTAPGMF